MSASVKRKFAKKLRRKKRLNGKRSHVPCGSKYTYDPDYFKNDPRDWYERLGLQPGDKVVIGADMGIHIIEDIKAANRLTVKDVVEQHARNEIKKNMREELRKNHPESFSIGGEITTTNDLWKTTTYKADSVLTAETIDNVIKDEIEKFGKHE